MSYSSITFNDPALIKRQLQNRRIEHAASAAETLPKGASVLDYGAGNGELCKILTRRRPDLRLVCYEPAPQLREEARNNLSGWPAIDVLPEPPRQRRFERIFCLEVFEHLPPAEMSRVLDDFHKMLAPDGRVVLGVPNEIFLMALMKGLFRKWRRPRDYDTSLPRILKATLGKTIEDRPVDEISAGHAYHFHHLGFDYRALEKRLREDFTVVDRFQSPFRRAPVWMNSECYFILQSKKTDV